VEKPAVSLVTLQLKHLIFERHTFGIVLFEPGVGGFIVGEDLEVIDVADILRGPGDSGWPADR
jgi:hypothetical protein